MEWQDDKIVLDKELNKLDKLVLDFIEILEDFTNYVLISGYVAILFGRSRGTEDVDIAIQELSRDETNALFERLKEEGYWCMNTSTDVYEMLSEELAVRFAEEGEVTPNFEVRFALDELEKDSLDERIEVRLRDDTLYVSPLELQIAYKLFLGSEKDFEDALHLYELFRENLNINKLESYCRELEVNLDGLREA